MIARLFVGVNAVGLWDELFFICTVYTLLLRHFRPWLANLLQAVDLRLVPVGARLPGVGTAADDPVRARAGRDLLAGRRTSLYVVTVHLLFDAVVFLVIVHAHHQEALPIFPLVHGF